MTDTAKGPQQRRLGRIVSAMNRKARQVGARGSLTAFDLAVIARDHPRCAYCSIDLELDQGSFDHVVPLDRGGANLPANLVRCCYGCNRTKFTKTPDEMRAHAALEVQCPVCGTTFQPRWAEYLAGRARYCSRSCSAKSRWIG